MSSKDNILGTAPIGRLMRKFAMPSIVGMLVTSIYNIVDQVFIGQAVGELGNAATNIAFPAATICVAIALCFGIGGAAAFNLHMGRGEKEDAPYYVGNAFMMLILCGVLYFVITRLSLESMMRAFGAPNTVLPYAMDYVGITSFGYPFVILTVGGGHLIRADGSPSKAMLFNLSGAIINVFLDYMFTMVIRWEISGAALATIIGQVFSGILTIRYMMHYRTVQLKREHLRLSLHRIGRVASLGMAASINQLSMMVTQIVSNNLLKKYGALSIYGESIPIACAGIVSKINMLVLSVIIGIGHGSQPICSFNYGAKKYDRVRAAYRLAMLAGILISGSAFVLIQLFPGPIFSAFGSGSDLYLEYGIMYLRVFLMFMVLSTVQQITYTFFSSIGKPVKGMILALVKQIGVMIPLMFILTLVFGVNGVMYSGPAADCIAAILSIVMAVFEFRDIRKKESAL